MHPLDIPLGDGAHVEIRALIGRLGRPYSPAPFVRDHAVALIAAGDGAPQARAFLLALCQCMATAAEFSAAVALRVRRHGVNAWSMRHTRAFAAAVVAGNPNNLTPAAWAAIAAVLPRDAVTLTETFARVQGAAAAAWTGANALALAQAYIAPGGNPNGFAAARWTQLARALPANLPLRVAIFARVRGAGNTAWTARPAQRLTQLFAAANLNNFSVTEWCAIAGVLPADSPTDVAAFACVRGAANAAWNAAGALALATAFAAAHGNPNALTAADWVQIAGAGVANQHATVTAFARTRGVGNTAWNAVGVVALAQAYAAQNPNGFTAAQWTAVAQLLPANSHADVTTFACANPGWNHGQITALATLFGQNAHGQTAAAWIAMSDRMAHRNGWEQLTQRAMRYRQLAWPDTIQVRTVAMGALAAWHLEASNDGVVYRVTGVNNPHLTLHNVAVGPWQWGQNADLHLRAADGRLWDYVRRQFSPFLHHGQHAPVPSVDVVATIDSACTALGV